MVATGRKDPLITVVNEILDLAGDPLTEGYGARVSIVGVDSKDGTDGISRSNDVVGSGTKVDSKINRRPN
ncbi:MAG: hypothetical protein GJU76_02610 [Gallionella sp.]|nr:hypothetical protein [Gallionella sp.]